MNVIIRIINRWRFRKTLKGNQAQNVVDGMVKAKSLYKELCRLSHPDKHPDNREMAEEIMKRVVANRHDYSKLLDLQIEIEEKL